MNKIALSVLTLSIFLGASPFVTDALLLEQETQFRQNMTALAVSDEVTSNGTRVGINPGQNLDFGEIETGIRVTKFLDFQSDRERLVKLTVEGNISEKVNTTDAQIMEGEKRLGIAFKSDDSGYFTGEATLKTYTPNGRLGELWLDLKTRFF